MSMPAIHIVGLGVSEKAELMAEAKAALSHADLIIGSDRQLKTVSSLVGHVDTKLHLLPKLRELKTLLQHHSDQQVVLLASGDPLFYGIGRWVGKHFSTQQLHYYPAVSSVQAACHKLGISLQDTQVISLHGRPLESLNRYLKPHLTLIALTDKNSTPSAIARTCLSAGFEQVTFYVCEKLGYADEQVRQLSLNELLEESELSFDPLHVTVIQLGDAHSYLPSFPGIEDQNFMTGAGDGAGMLTKREVRLAILSLMQVSKDDVVWDIGAGCGGVAIELAFWQAQAQVHAIEHHSQRLGCLEENRKRFGVVGNLQVVAGRASQAIADLPTANKVFIGGSDGELPELLQRIWQQLPERGFLVASAVTEKTKGQLLAFVEREENVQMETLQVAVSKGSVLAGQLLYRPNLPVTLFKLIKGGKA